MDLIPKPDQVVTAAGNVAHRVVSGGMADLRPMPRIVVDEGPLREVYHYRPAEPGPEQGDPVLLVSPLAAPASCYDLRRGCSLVEHLVDTGRPTYVVEYGEVSFKDRDLEIDPWIKDVVPAAIRAVSEHAGGRPVHVVGWSVGGIFALLAAAGDPALPIASIVTVGAPFDVREVPMVAPPRPLLSLVDGRGALARLYQAAGGAPPLVRCAFQLSPVQRLVTKPLAIACHLDDADYLAQLEAVGHFSDAMTAYRGRTFGQLYHRLLPGNALVEGTFEGGGRRVSVADVRAPVLVLAGASDTIAPLASVKASVPLLTGSREARLEIVPGGHLGALTGRQARTGTWPVLGEWIDEWSADVSGSRPNAGAAPDATSGVPAPPATTRRTTTRAGAKKAAAPKKGTSKKAASKTAARTAADEPTDSSEIGTNPTRRYGSGGSRSLGR